MQVELVEPPEDSAPGDRVSVQGFEEEPDEQLNPKKKIFEQVSCHQCIVHSVDSLTSLVVQAGRRPHSSYLQAMTAAFNHSFITHVCFP